MLFYHSSKSSAYSRVRSEGSCFLDRASGVGGLFACRGRTVYGENEKRLCVRRCESACRDFREGLATFGCPLFFTAPWFSRYIIGPNVRNMYCIQ